MNAQRILDFWFGALSEEGLPHQSQNKLWFGFDPTTDQRIKRDFEPDLLNADKGLHDDWRATPTGRLALIIILDQFPRNIYRGTARAFSYDPLALNLCIEGIEIGHDSELIPIHRIFHYMPLQHSESIEHQELSVKKMHDMRNATPAKLLDYLEDSIRYAEVHRDIILRFGRFPHRNRILGRTSSAEEREYLENAGTGFGQN